jgi:7,8-dihydropterin-6-yl-methyl-4-(beta-D-ribofuranosyl)aminobenzene 5'-phosphate synthase
MTVKLKTVDKVEILTLQDNRIDLVATDSDEVVQRPIPLEDMEFRKSIRAEHGFSTLITITHSGTRNQILFDFGFSEDGAAANAIALNADLTEVELLVLSHGHLDHLGGLARLVAATGNQNLDLVVHPGVFVESRYRKITEDLRVYVPALSRETTDQIGVNLIETIKPLSLLNGIGVFLGQIPRVTPFEQGAPDMYYQKDGAEKRDPFDDDSAIVFHVDKKGLVIISGCAHSGIVNTVKHAQQVTGIPAVYAIMGGFHLSGADFEGVITPTTEGLKEIDPHYIIPTHCSGREAVQHIEKEMPDAFLLNMSGTKMTFDAQQ